MTKDQLKAFAAEGAKLLTSLGEKYGVAVEYGGGTYGAAATVKFRLNTVQADGTVVTPEASMFKAFAQMKGFATSDLGRTFTARNGYRYTITGMTKTGKIALQRQDGRNYTMHSFDVKRYIETAEVAK